jgi:hypothetical protein
MAEDPSQVSTLQDAERYYAEHVQLDAEIVGSPEEATRLD